MPMMMHHDRSRFIREGKLWIAESDQTAAKLARFSLQVLMITHRRDQAV